MNKPCPAGDGYKGCVDAGDGTCIACGEELYPKASPDIRVPSFNKSSVLDAPQVISPISDAERRDRKEWIGLIEENQSLLERLRSASAEKRLELYATAARVIALHLERFCDESLSYDQMIADAARKAGDEIRNLESQFQLAKEWNDLNKLERDILCSRLDAAEEDMSIQGVRMGEAQQSIYALRIMLLELCEKMEAGISGPEETKRARALLNLAKP